MTQARPIVRDVLPESGGPVVAAHRTPEDVAGTCRSPRSPATHTHAVLAFCTGGRARMEQNGMWRLGAGDVLLVPAGARHRIVERRELEYWGLSFFAPTVRSASLLEPLERVRDGASAVVSIPAARHGYLEGLFRELARVGDAPRDPDGTLDAVQQSLLTLVLADVASAAGSDAAGSGAVARASGGVVADALRFIERNCLGRLTVRDVAAAVGRSPTYVTTALTQATGRSAVQWIVSARMAEARRLLLHSDEMVDVIAERVGYADATHFIRMFRREHGATPAAWRAARAARSGIEDHADRTEDRALRARRAQR